ncbi:hypothetical protein Tco_1506306 [Tanacetum coccineum]
MTLDQFTGTLFNTTSSEYSPTPPKDESKGKGIVTEENPLKDLIPLMDEGGSAPKMPNINSFSTSEKGKMTIEEVKAQLQEMQRLAMLKQEKEKSKARLKVLTPAEIRARAQKLAEFEAKRKRMLEEYNHYITYRADQHLIIKISYKINKSTKHATMRIERNNQPLSLTVYEKFVLKMLGFSEWIKVHALASKNKSKTNYLLLRNLKAKFEWLKTQARKLGIPPPPELSPLGFSLLRRKENEA